MPIISPRLRFREMTHDDFPLLCTMLQDPAVMYAWEYTFSDAEVRAWIDRNQERYREFGYGYLLADDRETGETVGQIGLLPEEFDGRQHLGVGWILRRSHWHRGYAVEGAGACLEYAFRELHAPRVIADIRSMNTASLNVARRLGMLYSGTSDKIVKGKIMPHELYYRRNPHVEVRPYDPAWPEAFATLRNFLAPLLARYGCRLEHVGSTAVPGLAAKPVIDADFILNDPRQWPGIRTALATLGFQHRGDGGLPGREMFTESLRLDFRHNFYVCMPDSPHLTNHLRLRDYLRSHPEAAARYGALKTALAQRHPEDVDSYCAGKSDLLAEFLAAIGLDQATITDIHAINQAMGGKNAQN